MVPACLSTFSIRDGYSCFALDAYVYELLSFSRFCVIRSLRRTIASVAQLLVFHSSQLPCEIALVIVVGIRSDVIQL